MTFLISEDEALRNLMKGMTVTDQKASGTISGTRNVPVYFGQPDQELREQTYPYITIDMIDIAEDVSRAHRGKAKPAYMDDPTTVTTDVDYDPEVHNWEINWPIPVNIDYQITAYSRQPRHDRQLLSQIMHTRLPLRFGTLELDDNTVRRLDILDVSKRDITESGKRLFVNAFTVRVSSEIASEIYNTKYKATQVIGTGYTGTLVRGGTEQDFTAVDSWTNPA